MKFSVTNPTDFVDWSKTIHKIWSCSFWTQPHRGSSLKDQPPRNTPDLFCRRFTRQNHRCATWAVFFTNRTLCGCTILWNSFLVVGSTTSKRYSCAWKKQDTVSALCPAFFIPNLESFISRLNVILRHNLTLSVGEPDNAAAKQGQELRSEQTVTSLHEQSPATYFLRLNNLETFVENAFWAQR